MEVKFDHSNETIAGSIGKTTEEWNEDLNAILQAFAKTSGAEEESDLLIQYDKSIWASMCALAAKNEEPRMMIYKLTKGIDHMAKCSQVAEYLLNNVDRRTVMGMAISYMKSEGVIQ